MNISHSNLNSTNSSVTPNIFGFMNDIDNASRMILLATHTLYLFIVIFFKEFQKVSYFNMTHINIIGFLTGIHYCLWINKKFPTFDDIKLNEILCSVSEVVWAVFKYARAYSILVLAVYRYIAVYRAKSFSQISRSIVYAVLSSVLVWLVSGIIFLIAKYSGQSYPGLIICYDGYALTRTNTIIYYVITSLLGFVLPIVLVCFFYFKIQSKLNKLSHNLHHEMQNPQLGRMKDRTQKEKKLAVHFILINLLEILSCVFLMLLTVCNLVPNFNDNYYYLRQLCRILNNISQSFIPLISIYFHQSNIRFRNMIFFTRITNSSLPANSIIYSFYCY